jgi:ferric-dicitrate binding protein FerR (iron transport regulator)
MDIPMNQLIIPYGKTSEVILSDGTTVFLNAGSRLIYPESFTGKTREVFLSGEAFFDVKKDANRPFIVQLDVFRVKVFGTRFNVSAYPTDNIVETVLAEGRVSMFKNNARLLDKPIELIPNQLASFDRTTKETSLKTVNTDNYILWTTGVLKFESADLQRIVQRLERYYNIRIEINDSDLGSLHISGKLELKNDPDEICDRVGRAASVKIIKKEKDLYEVLR